MNMSSKKETQVPDLLVEGRRVRADVEVGLSRGLVDVLQAVSIGVHDEARVVVKEHAHAVVTQLVAWNTHTGC